MLRFVVPFLLVFATQAFADEDPAVFKSDVAMTRVDAQVVDANGRPITGLEVGDFTLRLDGHVLPIRNIASENMPLDILLLLDVSGSMQPHVQRIASAAQEALNVLAPKDRVAIMIFDTVTRVRLPFRNSHTDVTSELNHILRSEGFNGGTRITHALLEATSYLQREGRPEARRAIVVLTDDQTQDEEEEGRVESALAHANAVLSFLQAPYEPPGMNGGGPPRRHGTWGSGGGGWPGGGGIGFPGSGPVTLGRGPGVYGGDRSHTAGTADIAHESGGDTMQVEDATALQDTLERLRQRYALYFYLPEGSRPAGQGAVKVDLSPEGRRRFEDAEIHYRRVYLSGDSTEHTGATAVTRAPATPVSTGDAPADDGDPSISKGRRVAVNESSGAQVNTVDPNTRDSDTDLNPPGKDTTNKGTSPTGGWPRVNHFSWATQ